MIFAQTDIVTLLAIVVALVVGITCHEFSHALVADYLGDHRPRAMGRVSLNPIRHIDPLGALLFIAAGFGWGRPVMVNAAAMRGGRRSMAWVAVWSDRLSEPVTSGAFHPKTDRQVLIGKGLEMFPREITRLEFRLSDET